MRKKLLVSFSGGLTSAYMTKWILDNLSNQYEMIVVYANTGKEREETLQFVNECDKRSIFTDKIDRLLILLSLLNNLL